MTEQRLKEIFIETVFPTVGVTDETLLWFETVSLRQDYIEAMKQAVNEALDEAAENVTLLDPAMNIKCKSGHGFVVDKQSILNLKVK